MADEFQYVKMPDGSYGKFNAGVSDDVIRQTITKNFPNAYGQSESQMVAQRPDQKATFDIPRSPAEMVGAGLGDEAAGNAQTADRYVQAGPMEIGGGVKDISQGNVSRGLHRAIGGAGVTALPAIASTAPIAAMTAPFATGGALALGAIGQQAGSRGGRAVGLSPDQADLAGDVLGLVGGYGGAKAGGVGDTLVKNFPLQITAPEGVKLPFGFKIGRPPDPLEEKLSLPQRAYAEMQEDLAPKPTPDEIAQKRLNQKVANISAEVRAGLRPSPEEDIQSILGKEFLAGESAGKPKGISFPTPKPGVATKAESAAPRALGAIGKSEEPQPSGVMLAPIKSGPFPNKPAGNIQNVPRELLPEIIQRTGDPSAVSEFSRTTNTPTLFVPESMGGGPRSVTPLGSIGSPKINFMTDSMGVNWAERNGVRVSIPKSVSPGEMQDYAVRKLAEQEAMQKAVPRRIQ